MIRPLLFFFFTTLYGNSFSQAGGKAKMFRDNPAHSSSVSTGADLVYDTKAWRFDAGSPIRSTPLINDNTVFFGTAAGVFIALDKKTSQVKWKYNAGTAIHSSAACEKGKVYFSDNGQTLYCLKELNGQLLWKVKLGEKTAYPWRYDYYYSSPVLHDDKVLIGSEDGCLYALNPQTGKQLWKFKSKGIIRSTAAVYKEAVLFGDTEASLYAVDLKTGKELWQYRINGDTMNNEDYGFDRRAITSSPVIVENKAIFGARDGFLYCINADNGKGLWKMDHYVSWVISTVAVKDSFVVTGTSDGRFVQAVNIETGKEIWKFRTPLAVWSSPLIVDDKVYAGTFDGQLYCIDLRTGQRVSQFKVNGKIMSSPVWDGGLLYFGADDGYLYALSGHPDKRQFKGQADRYVYYEPGVSIYFRGNSDLMTRNYLRSNGYKVIGADSLAYYMSRESVNPSVFVFATSYFPSSVTENGKNSIIRKYLDRGGKIVMTGINPIVYKIDDKSKQPFAFRPGAADTLFSLDYGKGDTRTFMGDIPCFPTEKGKQLGLPDFWSTSLFIHEKNVDVVLGKNENGDVSAFAKNYSNGGQLVQLWLDADKPDRLDAVIKAAEWKIE
ncbi:MAG: PQQ-binding-like beta-propeller repeat protein [Chitinophagaceae bacterium]|nr:PQQ-binding-like beta-propeller repeat protein [Chitinophagaceae bacterium]